MVTISSPTNRVVPRGTTRFSWTCSYPQTAYEFQFRPVGATAWSTMGRVISTAQSVDIDVSKLTDFAEYHFRIVIYADPGTSGTTIYNGNEKSAVYSIIVSPPKQLAKLRGKYGTKMLEIPIYESSNNDDATHVAMDGVTKGVMPPVDPKETTATALRFEHPKGTRAFGNATSPTFTAGKIPAETYMQVDTRNTQYRYYYRYAYDTYYVNYYLSSYSTRYSSQNLGNYLIGYSSKYNKTYYRGYYLSGATTKYDKTYYKGATANYSWKYDRTYEASGSSYLVPTYTWKTYDPGISASSYPYYYYYPSFFSSMADTCWVKKANGTYYTTYREFDIYYMRKSYVTSATRGYSFFINRGSPPGSRHPVGTPIWEEISTTVYRYYGYKAITSYTRYYGYYAYTSSTYARYYGYYRYYYGRYAAYYKYYTYYQANYSPYYSYYRYTTTYKQTYYTYSRAYRYA